MSSGTNEDLRSIKTERALYAAMCSLLETQNFRKITVKGICEEAYISRAAFYTHFIDKYDLLEHWVKDLWAKTFDCGNTYEQIEEAVNFHLKENLRLLKNLMDEADNETYGILFEFILSTKNLTLKKGGSKELYHENVVLSNFYAGGIISYLLWQIKHKFPSDVPLMNRDFYEMLNRFGDWQSGSCKG